MTGLHNIYSSFGVLSQDVDSKNMYGDKLTIWGWSLTISKDDLESSLNLDFLHLYAWGECVSIIVGSKGHDGPLWMLIYHVIKSRLNLENL